MKYIAKVSITLSSEKKITKTIGPFRVRGRKTPEHVALETASSRFDNFDYDSNDMIIESLEPFEEKVKN